MKEPGVWLGGEETGSHYLLQMQFGLVFCLLFFFFPSPIYYLERLYRATGIRPGPDDAVALRLLVLAMMAALGVWIARTRKAWKKRQIGRS